MPLTNEKFLFFVGARGEPGNEVKVAVGDLRNLERGVQSLARAPKNLWVAMPTSGQNVYLPTTDW